MHIETMRKAIMNAYPGVYWKDRCQHMPPRQVEAIYKSLHRTGKLINGRPAKKYKDQEEYYQYTLFDFGLTR